jgi:hypothetical protein
MNDHPIEAVREARRKISEQFGHDPHKLVEHYKKLQERHKDRLISPGSEQPPESDAPAGEEVPAAADT